jgi:hypothetical protein
VQFGSGAVTNVVLTSSNYTLSTLTKALGSEPVIVTKVAGNPRVQDDLAQLDRAQSDAGEYGQGRIVERGLGGHHQQPLAFVGAGGDQAGRGLCQSGDQ